LDNISLLYILYIKYVDHDFQDRYPKINRLLNNLSSLVFYVNIFVFIYNLRPRPFSGPTGSEGSSGKGSSLNKKPNPKKPNPSYDFSYTKKHNNRKRKFDYDKYSYDSRLGRLILTEKELWKMKMQEKSFNKTLNEYLSQKTLTDFQKKDLEYIKNRLPWYDKRITSLKTKRSDYQDELNL